MSRKQKKKDAREQSTRQDYEALSDAVSDYLEVFQDMSQSADRAWEQTM